MTSNHWTTIAKEIHKRYHEYDGFLVTHGTDTMVDTGCALSYAFGKNLNKPIVLTGSQSYPSILGTDARFNLENAFRVVISDVADVVVSFGHYVFKAVRSQKRHESDFNAFMSPSFPEVAYIRSKIQWTPFTKKKSDKEVEIDFRPDFESGILNVKINASINPKMIEEMIDYKHVKGIIFESLGSGNIPHKYIDVIKKAIKLDIPVLISSPFVGGSTSSAETYKLGYEALKAGVIPTNDMTFTATYVKLMWCLAWINKSRENQNIPKKIIPIVRIMFHKSYVGEVTIN